jgi:hypothetical protein
MISQPRIPVLITMMPTYHKSVTIFELFRNNQFTAAEAPPVEENYLNQKHHPTPTSYQKSVGIFHLSRTVSSMFPAWLEMWHL